MEGKVVVYSQVLTGANSKLFSRQKVKLGLDHLESHARACSNILRLLDEQFTLRVFEVLNTEDLPSFTFSLDCVRQMGRGSGGYRGISFQGL